MRGASSNGKFIMDENLEDVNQFRSKIKTTFHNDCFFRPKGRIGYQSLKSILPLLATTGQHLLWPLWNKDFAKVIDIAEQLEQTVHCGFLWGNLRCGDKSLLPLWTLDLSRTRYCWRTNFPHPQPLPKGRGDYFITVLPPVPAAKQL